MKNILERVTILPKDNDEIEAKIRAKLDSLSKEKQQLNFDPIIRWYRNDVKNNISQEELKHRYIDNLNNVIDEIVEYYNMLEKHPNIANEKITINNKEILAKNLSEIRKYENALKYFSEIRKLANRRIAQKTPEEFELQTDDILAIELIGESEHIMAWETRGYETTNKFVFNLWQNSNMNVDYGDKEINSPYCTRMKEHWDSYSQGIYESEYRQIWFLKKLDGDFKYNKGTLNNPNVKKIFDAMKGFGPDLILAMDDSGLDLLNDIDETYGNSNKPEEFFNELIKLDCKLLANAIENCKNKKYWNFDDNDDYDEDDDYDEENEDDEDDEVYTISYDTVKSTRALRIEISKYLPDEIDIDFKDVPKNNENCYDILLYIINLLKKHGLQTIEEDFKNYSKFDKVIKIKNVYIPTNIKEFKLLTYDVSKVDLIKNLNFSDVIFDFSKCTDLVFIQTNGIIQKIVFADLDQYMNCDIVKEFMPRFYGNPSITLLATTNKIILPEVEKDDTKKLDMLSLKFRSHISCNTTELVFPSNFYITNRFFENAIMNIGTSGIKTVTIYGNPIFETNVFEHIPGCVQTLNFENASALCDSFISTGFKITNMDKKCMPNITINIYNLDDVHALSYLEICKQVNIYNSNNYDYSSGTLTLTSENIHKRISKSDPLSDLRKNYDEFTIPSGLCSCNKFIKHIKILEPIKIISDDCFFKCINLESAEIPSTATTLGCSVFSHCDKLKNIIFKPNNNKLILRGNCFFETGIEKIDFSYVNSIQIGIDNYDSTQFHMCKNLQEVKLPKTIINKYISIGMFEYCLNLESINLGDIDIEEIKSRAFLDCKKLNNIKFPNTLKKIGEDAFLRCNSLEEIDLSNTKLEQLSRNAFCNCQNLKIVKLPATLKYVGQYTFYDCPNLEHIYIPKELEHKAFPMFANKSKEPFYRKYI